MKKHLFILLAGLFVLSSCADDVLEGEGTGSSSVIDLTENGTVVPGVIRVKLKNEPAADISVSSHDGAVVVTGIKTLDVAGTTLKITRMERVFPNAGQYEERTRREGLHLWYNVWYEEAETASRAAQQVAVLDGIAAAEPVYAIQTRELSPADTRWALAAPRTGEWLYDDPYSDRQWYLQNGGTESWQAEGADVGLPDEVWSQYHGDKSIVVAVVDGGIQYTHPDLADNMWEDENGAHGWNFLSNTSHITFYNHATHVAGLVAAVNNNGIGISSIAGGDGTENSGVKLMSCQIINPNGYSSNVDYAAAIKYGADHGAIISQNSWGYKTAQQTAQTEKDAIDYFVKYAGCDEDGNQLPDSPMKGGIVLFASGNANSSDVTYAAPADYEPVVSVAAIGPNFVKAPYSNYGSYMDIAAPGGLDTSISAQGIWSTSTNSSYEYMAGTSMACPLVSAACALIIQKYGVGQPGFTPDKLKDILLGSVTNIDSYNPSYVGQLGAGALNIERALSMDVDNLSAFELYSNRITDGKLMFKASSELSGSARLQLYNGTGYKVYDQPVSVGVYAWFTLDVSNLSAGYYTLKYECNGKTVKENFIKY